MLVLLNFLEINETKPCISAAMECRALLGWLLVPALLPDEQHTCGEVDLSRLCCTWCVLLVKDCFWLGEGLEDCMFGDYLVESFWPGLVLRASSLGRVMWLTNWLVSLLPHSTILLSFIHLLRDVKKLNWYWKVLQGLRLKGVTCVWWSTVASLDVHPYIFLCY